MFVLIIDPDSSKEHYENLLSDNNISDIRSVFYFNNVTSGKNFLIENVLQHQNPLDVIISKDKGYNPFSDYEDDIILWIQNLNESFYDHNFKFSSIPIIRIPNTYNNISRDSFNSLRNRNQYSPSFHNSDSYNHQFISDIITAVKNWRSLIFDDFTFLNLPFSQVQQLVSNWSNPKYYTEFGNNPKYYSKLTKILSEDFISSPHKLDYDWLNFKLISSFHEKIENYQIFLEGKYSKPDDEKKKLHPLFRNSNESLLKLGLYKRSHYEPSLNDKILNWKENPDFLKIPYYNKTVPVEIDEFKLPDKSLTSHKAKVFRSALTQAKLYKSGFANKSNLEFIRDNIDREFNPEGLKVRLILSKNQDFSDMEKEIYDRLGIDVEIITHKQNLTRISNYYERLKMFSHFDKQFSSSN
ncbi:MAG: hypothetical protein KBB37_01225 [Bacteroidia bacterium]|nr:hypothetical protein [Bacteroidia bacterium]MBP7259880.1 hypothetical protein [Bacteroidia bacterium]MBP9179949.1 hypothetical protein [Bacteroidia bacterium]MBP9723481.1 hypothetical protein [Bacteroidia bacterium]